MKPPLWATLCTIGGILILCGLGVWQLERLQWKGDLLEKLNAEYAKNVREITIRPADLDADFEYMRGTLQGYYDFDKQILLGQHVYKNLPGQHVYTPLQLNDGSYVLVDRGWVPQHWHSVNELETDRKAAQSGHVGGLIRKPWEGNSFTPENNPQSDEWYRVDIPQIAAARSLKNLRPYILVLEARETEGNYPIAQGRAPEISNNHLQYAIFWFVMAGVLAVIYALRFLKKPAA